MRACAFVKVHDLSSSSWEFSGLQIKENPTARAARLPRPGGFSCAQRSRKGEACRVGHCGSSLTPLPAAPPSSQARRPPCQGRPPSFSSPPPPLHQVPAGADAERGIRRERGAGGEGHRRRQGGGGPGSARDGGLCCRRSRSRHPTELHPRPQYDDEIAAPPAFLASRAGPRGPPLSGGPLGGGPPNLLFVIELLSTSVDSLLLQPIMVKGLHKLWTFRQRLVREAGALGHCPPLGGIPPPKA